MIALICPNCGERVPNTLDLLATVWCECGDIVRYPLECSDCESELSGASERCEVCEDEERELIDQQNWDYRHN